MSLPNNWKTERNIFYIHDMEDPENPTQKGCLVREMIGGWTLSPYDEYGIAYFSIFNKKGEEEFWLNVGNYFEENTKTMEKFIKEFDPSYFLTPSLKTTEKPFCAYQPIFSEEQIEKMKISGEQRQQMRLDMAK